jgi:TRAP-type C4-dicarboxylate transport system substrate-binding protein
MQLGTVDMIISGPSFAARSYPRLGIAYYPFIFRDGDHLLAYSKSPVFKEMIDGYREKTGIQILAYTYYGARHTTSKTEFKDCAGMKGLKIRVPDVPSYRATPESCGANPTPIAFAEVYLALQNGTVDAGKPADDDRGQEVLRGAEAHHADWPHRRWPDHPGGAACVEQAE